MTRCIRLLRPLALGILAVVLIAAEPLASPTADSWEKLEAVHIDALLAYASAGGDNKSGSLELELREQALAFARRIDSKSPKLKNLFARKRAMTPDEQKADRALRDQVLARDRDRLANKRASEAPPNAKDLAAELEALCHRLLSEQIAMAKRLSLDPDDPPTVVLRKSILTQVKVAIGPTKWAWEKHLKDQVDDLMHAKYEPWIGVWMCSTEGWDELTLLQDGSVVTGSWKNGTLKGEAKGRHVVGSWIGQGSQHGGFSFTLGENDLSFSSRVTDQVDRPTSWTAVRKDSISPPTILEVDEPADEVIKPEPELAK